MKKVLFITPLLFIIFGFSVIHKKTKEEKFWVWFLKHQEKIYHHIEDVKKAEKIYNQIENQLKKVETNLTFEFSPILSNKTREFTISAEGNKKHFATVKKLVKKAPKLKKWKIHALKQRATGNHHTVNYGDVKLSCCDIYFRYKDGKYGDIGIELNIRNYDGKIKTQEATFHLLDKLIGEYDHTYAIKWVDWVLLDEKDVEHLEPFFKIKDLINQKKKKPKNHHVNFAL